eukprot:GFUD01002795.1.p1 GENE.GFUD01002795.1~~GFUD01002795.1.p1  ORF type:complete len:442 (-),score=37.29 GFUD01002795.1:480-1805(-)
MFMFRSRRGNLVKKLWKLQCRDEKQSQAQDDRRNVATAMLKRLKEPALEGLVRAVEGQGADTGSCCLVPKGDLRLGRHTVSPHLLCCQLFRWSDLTQEWELVRLPLCMMTQETDQLYTCCNPFHWARLAKPGSSSRPGFTSEHTQNLSGHSSASLPGYSSNCLNSQTPSYSASTSLCTRDPLTPSPNSAPLSPSSPSATSDSSEPASRNLPPAYSSLTPCTNPCTNGEMFWAEDDRNDSTSNSTLANSVATGGSTHNCSSTDSLGRVTWCTLAYWEERTRVGRLFQVRSGGVEVFSQLPRPSPLGDAMCLATLATNNLKPSESTLKTREKIGLGVILSHDEQGVWAYNRTEVPIFVNSPTLDVPNSRTYSVFKIPPGYSLQIFNYEIAKLYQRLRDPSTLDGPFDPNAVRISFAKGWGPNYSRQFIDCCPCWLEILLVPPR